MGKINTKLAPLALVNISGLGIKGIANVLARNAKSERTLVDFFHLDVDTWSEEYRMTPDAVNILCDQKSLEADTQALQQRLAELGIKWFVQESNDFPLIFAFGNNALLEKTTVALLNSKTSEVEPKSLENTHLLTQRYREL